MGLPTRDREGNFRLIFGRCEIHALIGLFRSMSVRSALPNIFWQRIFLVHDRETGQ